MQTVQEIFEYLAGIAPLALQTDFDNSGFLVGRHDQQVSEVLLALDITDAVIEEAIQTKSSLIVSHHPVIWKPLRSVTDEGAGAKVLKMIEHQIAAICMHTNLDIAEGGVNDVLINRLGACVTGSLDKDNCGRIGHLQEPLQLPAFLSSCKEALNANGLRYYDAGRPVFKIAVMGGAGADALEDAWRAGCDTYVTADVKYHQFQQASELGMNLIDADHFSTENPVMQQLAAALQERFPSLRIRLSETHKALIDFS